MEQNIVDTVNGASYTNSWLGDLMIICTTVLPWLLILLVVALWFRPFWSKREPADRQVKAPLTAIFTAAALSLSMGLGQIVVLIFPRDRPFVTDKNVHLLTPHAADPGFPSDHAIFAAAVFLGILFFWRRSAWVWAAAILALILSISRLAVGVHWPSDILGGWFVALLGTALVWLAVRYWQPVMRLALWCVGIGVLLRVVPRTLSNGDSADVSGKMRS